MSHEVSSGNVFADLGFEDAEEMAVKSDLVRAIRHTMDRRGLTQVQVSKLTGVDQPTLSKLLRGRMSNFSLDRLTEMLRALGRNIVVLLEEDEPELTKLPTSAAQKQPLAKRLSKGQLIVRTAAAGKFKEVSGAMVVSESIKEYSADLK